MNTGNWLSRRIADSGRPWRYDEFLEAALYDPDHGFYGSGRGRAGRRGDFLTSAEVGPLFGAVLARALDSWWVELGRPKPFTVVEAGAGVGTLARSVLAAQPACQPRYLAVERSAVLRCLHPSGVQSLACLPLEGVGAGVVVANELLDNLAFGIAEFTNTGWREVLIDPTGQEVLGPAVSNVTTAKLSGARNGARIPLQSGAARWVAEALGVLHQGRVVAFDYVTPTTASLAKRPYTDWLRTYRGHGRGGQATQNPGEQDVTTEVALDQLPPAEELVTQGQFLRRHGIEELVAQGRRIWRERAGIGDIVALQARSRIGEAEALLDPQGLGGFGVVTWAVPIGG